MRIETFNIYELEEARTILCSYLEKRKNEEPKFSVRKWSKNLGQNSHSLLTLQLQGKRKIKPQHVDFLAESMGLTEVEKRYFKGITVLEKSTSEEEKRYNLCHLLQSIPQKYIRTKKYREFSLIANWLNMAIMSLSEIDGFLLTESNIEAKLGHRATRSEILSSLELLKREGLLEAHENIFKPVYQSVCTSNEISDAGIREYHKGACDLAKSSIESVDMDHREFQSFCLGVPEDKLDLAKELIRKFRDDFYRLVGGSGEDIYKMNIQFFQLSRSTDQSGAREFVSRMQ